MTSFEQFPVVILPFRPVDLELRMIRGNYGKRLHDYPKTMHGNPSTFYIKVGLISQLHSFHSVSVAQFHGSDVLFQVGGRIVKRKAVETIVSVL